MATHKLYVNKKKCEFFGLYKIAYLGHIVSVSRVAIDKMKVQTMFDWPSPRLLKELKGFLGRIGYYSWFITGYAHIATSLTQQLKNFDTDLAFKALKSAME